MAELAMLADIQRTVYPEEVTRQLHVMAQATCQKFIEWNKIGILVVIKLSWCQFLGKRVTFSHTRYRVLGPEVIPVNI